MTMEDHHNNTGNPAAAALSEMDRDLSRLFTSRSNPTHYLLKSVWSDLIAAVGINKCLSVQASVIVLGSKAYLNYLNDIASWTVEHQPALSRRFCESGAKTQDLNIEFWLTYLFTDLLSYQMLLRWAELTKEDVVGQYDHAICCDMR